MVILLKEPLSNLAKKQFSNLFHMKKVLVIEDNKKYRELLKTALEGNKISVLEAGEGKEALDILEKEHVNLILLDLLMPGMDGIDFYHMLELQHAHIPILILTNVSDTAAYGKDIKEVLIKANVSLDDVIEKVKSALK